MQTFLPYNNFIDSARCLDYRRLGKQRVECKQILQALGVPVGGPLRDKPSSWRNHPATRMWQGHEYSLCVYAIAICDEWRRRGYRDTLQEQFYDAANTLLRFGKDESGRPPWLGCDEFHASHRSNLLRKLPAHYGKFGWSEPDNLEYVWPIGTALAV
jgi:hypothetical protein